jgi:hypothetical protein
MKAQAHFDTTFEQRIAKLDLSRVMEKVAKETGMDAQEIAVAEDLYRKFLTIKAENFEVDLVPPVIVDHVWDMHVQFTRQYAADCDLLFGQFLHHTPHTEADDVDFAALFAETRSLYQSQFNVNFTRMGMRAELFQYAQCF